MNPKSGKAGTAVKPADPKKALDADEADPGGVEEIKADQRKSQKGKYGSEKTQGSGDEPETAEEKAKKKNWIEIELVNEKTGKPVPGEPYEIKKPDGKTETGTLDDKGFVHLDGLDPGTCQVTFPRLDKRAWKKK